MNNYASRRPLILVLLLSACLVFLGVNGFVGGYLMLHDPYGAPMGMPVSTLENTIFDNFTVPGLCLIFIWGCGSLLTLLGLWLRPNWFGLDALSRRLHQHWSWELSLLLGVGLLVWLIYQVFTLPEVAPIQIVLFVLAALLVLLPLHPAMRRYYRIRQRINTGTGGKAWSPI